MKVIVDRPSKLMQVFEWVKGLATAPAHESNRELIADFLDKVLIPEMKADETKAEIEKEEVTIPDTALINPLRQIRAKMVHDMDDMIRKLTNGAVLSVPVDDLLEVAQDPMDPNEEHELPTVVAVVQGRAVSIAKVPTPAKNGSGRNYSRQGNGHVSQKVRDLADSERDHMRQGFFLPANGQIVDDDCVKYLETRKTNGTFTEVAIFQVTGFISVLHRYIAAGSLKVTDLPAYIAWMQAKYPTLWKQYNSQKYQDLRQAVQASANLSPKFVPAPKRA